MDTLLIPRIPPCAPSRMASGPGTALFRVPAGPGGGVSRSASRGALRVGVVFGTRRPGRSNLLSGCAAHGFTLIEVMAVVIVISVIVASVLFSIDLTGNQKTRTAISDVQLLMRGLSNEAVLEGNHYGIKWERKAQRFTPVVETGGRWSAYSSLGGDRPDFRSVSWKGFAEVAMTIGGTFVDERLKDDENFYAGRDQEPESESPLVEFFPTGLWEPAGEIQFFVARDLYATLKWNATGKIELEPGSAP